MSTLLRCYPGDGIVEYWLVVTLVVALVSSAGWLVSRRLARHAALRHLVLYSALVSCLAAPAVIWLCFATGLALVSFPIFTAEHSRNVIEATPNEINGNGAALPPSTDSRAPASKLPLSRTTRSIDRSVKTAVVSEPEQLPATLAPTKADVKRNENAAATPPSIRGIVALALLVWATGGMLGLARLAWNCRRVIHLRCLSHLLQNERVQALLSDVIGKFEQQPVPLLLISARTVTPLAVGFGRPAIILPERLMEALSDDELRDVLLHELAHLVRGDQRIVLLQGLAGAMYWPIASVYGLNRELQRAREELSDNVVLGGRNAVNYGETLWHIAELTLRARPMGATVGIMHWKGKLEQRIEELIDPRRDTSTKAGRKTACIVMGLFIVGIGIASAVRLGAVASAAENEGGAVAQKTAPAASGIATKARRAGRKPKADASNAEDPAKAGHFNGQVRGPDGKPLKGARVYILPVAVYPGSIKVDSNGIGPVRAETGADGHFEFDAPDMTYSEFDGLPARREGLLIVTADGYAPDWMHTWGQMTGFTLLEDWMPVKGTPLDMHVAKDDVPIHGRFLDPNGKPLAGARVKLTMLMVPMERDLDAHLAHESKLDASAYFLSSGPGFERELYSKFVPLVPGLTTKARTDADGRFTMSGLGRDRLAVLTVSAPGVIDTSLTVMTRDAPDVGTLIDFNKKPTKIIHGAGFTLKLEPGRTIRGVVRDRDSHQPLPGMWVGQYNGNAGATADAYPAVTDDKGRFTITGLYFSKEKPKVAAIAPPGVPYQSARAVVEGDAEAVIECPRGIPFRLKLVDEQGKPVEAEVTHIDVNPNPLAARLEPDAPMRDYNTPAARRTDGTYEGFVLPGPGAVLIKTPRSAGYRQARVDTKAFFAPGRTNWTPEEQSTLYGTEDLIFGAIRKYDQREYSGIVLVNAPPDSKPLELSATLVRDPIRMVSLVDSDGKPVVGASMKTSDEWWEPHLRAATFPLLVLHPDRVRRIAFLKKDRGLVGFLIQQGVGATPYTVRMQPWGAITGRLVDQNGEPLLIWKPESDLKGPPNVSAKSPGDEKLGEPHAEADHEGRFRLNQLIPGHHYSGEAYFQMQGGSDSIFKDVVLGPGEVRDLGDIRTKLSYEPDYRRPNADDKKATANIPAEAWGKPVNGLRVAIVLKSPAVDKNEYLRYDIVAENVSDHDIRFGAGDHYEYGFNKVRLTDSDGNELRRQPGPRLKMIDTLQRIRIWLKPGERALIRECGTRLERVNEKGHPVAPPKQGEYFHFFIVRPGRYSISSTVVLGTGMTSPDPRKGPEKVNFAARGEWVGELHTGQVVTTLFQNSNK
jgi:beta-lactamase regulating signal transducer with metallopeptidase domain